MQRFKIHKQRFKFFILAAALLHIVLLPHVAWGQYSPDAFALKAQQDLFDERGMNQGAAISVDGQLAINNQNGGVTYVYNISSFFSGGHQVVSSINYCPAIQVTTFKDYSVADRAQGSPYEGWAQFSQNRPGWIYSVGGWAINVLSVASHVGLKPGSPPFNPLAKDFDDRHVHFLVDGWDFSNRMHDFGADDTREVHYRDVIRLLRGDGSLLELLNINSAADIANGDPDTVGRLYSGYYFSNEANARGYALVEFDSTLLSGTLRDYVHHAIQDQDERYPVTPRVLRYFAGDGTVAVFREKLAPFGMGSFKDYTSRSGGIWGHPSIFYLEEIRTNAGPIVQFHRPRHQRRMDGQGNIIPMHDETRGRALVTSYSQHTLSFGFNSLTVEALGRTTKIIFNTIHRNGTASANETFPWANLGGNTVLAKEMIDYDQLDGRLYKSFWGMVTEIRDANDRRTLLSYEQYSKKYQGFGFPREGNDISLLLKNYRLKTVTEPAAKYELSYHGDKDAIIEKGALTRAVNLNTMADSVRKYDRFGALLTTDRYTFLDATEVGKIITSTQTTIDHITGHERRIDFTYQSFPLNTHTPILTPGRHTVLTQTLEQAGGVQTSSTTSYATAATMPSWGGHGHYTVLPISQVVAVNGIPKSHQEFSYEMDTLRKFWPEDSLNGKFGMELTRKVTRTMQPNQPAKMLLADTTEYLHLPMIDTTLTWYEGTYNKFATIAKFFYYRDTVPHPDVVGRTWDQVWMRPPVVVYNVDTISERTLVPPMFGLTEKAWTTDTAGAVTGIRNVYSTTVMQGNLRAQRGLLLADSILGSNGERRLKGEYTYRREWNGDLLASTRNALGVENAVSYNFQFCEDILFWGACEGDDPVGTIVANDSTTRPYKLQWTPFSYLFAQPSMGRKIVRRYNIGGTLQHDTLMSYTERTFHGLAGATLDDNGFVSRYAYDYNGRLLTAWTPLDYPGTGVLDTFTYSGPVPVDLLGTTHHHRRIDTVYCWLDGQDQIPSDTILTGVVQTTINQDTLLASKPLTRVPQCPVLVYGSANEKGPSRQLQTIYQRWLPFDEYIGGYKGFFGVLPHRLDSVSPLKSALRVDSMSLELMVTSVEGTCVHLEVAIDSIFAQTFVLNCESEQDPGGDDPPDNGTKRQRRELQSGEITPVAGGYKLKVNLSPVVSQLRGRPNGSTADIELRVKTTGATVTFVNGTNADDLRPRLVVYGEYRKIWDGADYTVRFEHNDADLVTTEYAKVDDARHTNNDLAAQGISVRRSIAKNFFGGDYRHLKTERTIVEPDSLGNLVTRTDVSRQLHTGLGAVTAGINANGDTIVTHYDALGRPVETVNADGTRSTLTYLQGLPQTFGITDQEFFGYCDVKIITNEIGVKTAQFSDAFGRVRRQVTDYGDPSHLNLTTKMDFDVLGRLVRVRNPKGQVTLYTHNAFGEVTSKRQPDMGMITHAYDKLGNVRFTQDQKQAERNLVTFMEYDDGNRMTLMGEAYIDETGLCQPYDENNPFTQGCGDGIRLTEKLDPNVLHVAGGSILTANRKLYVSPVRQPNSFADISTFRLSECDELQPEPRLGETESLTLPLVVHPTKFYKLTNGIPGAPLEECEDIALHPEFARMAVAYDTLPIRNGSVWKNFPPYARWNALAPTGKIRNLRGREAAVAYREKASEPFHFSALSYDERGRVEALIRYNENLGFDAVYYSYNSANQVIAVTVADPVRKFSVWYGFDHQARVDTVWSKVYPPGSGLVSDGTFGSLRFPGVESHEGVTPEIVYSYTKLGHVKRMRYPAINVLVDYAYNRRMFLDSIVAKRTSGAPIFAQRLAYDSLGQITMQEYRHGAGATRTQDYGYDGANRLLWWMLDGNGDFIDYQYDAVGSRLQTTKSNEPPEIYTYYPSNNRLWYRRKGDGSGNDTIRDYEYDANGARTLQQTSRINGNQTIPLREEHFNYSFRGLLNRARVRNTGELWEDWRYRYNPMGEREQKRMYESEGDVVPAPDSTVYPWTYYLLGGNKEQLAVYHAQHLDSLQTECGDVGQNRVYLYAREYITHGVGQLGSLITRPNGTKEYKVMDHLGSTRAVLSTTGQIIAQADNAPFGEQIAVTGVDMRKQYIDREKDRETSTANHGVRQYDPGPGFASVDPMWEKYPALSPYSYSNNNPVLLSDPTGDTIKWDGYTQAEITDIMRAVRSSRILYRLWQILDAAPQTVWIGYRGSAMLNGFIAKSTDPTPDDGKGRYHMTVDASAGRENGKPVDSYIAFERCELLSGIRSANMSDEQHLEYAALGHELLHAWDRMRGLNFGNKDYEGVRMEEVRGVIMEQVVLEEFGKGGPMTYRGKSIPFNTFTKGLFFQFLNDLGIKVKKK